MSADDARVYRLLGAHEASSPVALGTEGARTALDLVRDAEAIAATLPAREGEILVVCADRYRAAACALAAWSRGRAVALPPNAQPGTVRDVAHAERTAVLLHDSDAPHGVDVRRIRAEAHSAYVAPPPIAADRHLATIWTSGSSGAPRLCAKTAAQLLGEAETLATLFGWGPGDVALSTVPSFHIYGLLFGVLGPLLSGAAFVRETPLFAPSIASLIVRTQATVLVSVPAHLRALETLTRDAVDQRVPRVCSSGAALTTETADALRANLGWTVTEIFGSTETGGIGWRTRTDAAYQPLPGVRVAVRASDASSSDGDGDEAQLVLRSPFTSEGVACGVLTEDRVQVEADGRFRPLGRVGGVVKVAGKRVSLAEVEARIRALPGVVDVAVLARSAPGARSTRLAAVVQAPGVSVEALRAGLREHLDPAVVPRPIVVVDALPREATGKLRKDALLGLLSPPGAPTAIHPSAGLVLTPRTEGGFAVHIPIDARAFRGHFAGEPVLPGIVQLDTLVLGAVRALWPELGHPRRITKLKFHRPVRPGDDLVVQVERVDARVAFSLVRRDAVCTNGVLFFGPALATSGGVTP